MCSLITLLEKGNNIKQSILICSALAAVVFSDSNVYGMLPNSSDIPPVAQHELRQVASAYIPTNDISSIEDYVVASNDGSKYSLAAVTSLIPPEQLSLIDNHEKLSQQYLYQLLRGIYVCMTGGTNNFPSSCPTDLDQRAFQNWAENIVVNLFKPLIDRMQANPASIPENFKLLMFEHSDAGEYADNQDWNQALEVFYRDLVENYGGLCRQVLNQGANQHGIYFNEDAVRFIAYSLMQRSDSDLPIGLIGRLSYAYTHCTQANEIGSSTAFSLFFQRLAGKNAASSFQAIMPVVSYMATQDVLRNVFYFGESPEELTYFGYVLGIWGQNGLFGLPSIGSMITLTYAPQLRLHFAREIVRALGTQQGWMSAQTIDSHARALCGMDNAVLAPYELPFRELFHSGLSSIPPSVQGAINGISDESVRNTVQMFCDCSLLLRNDYPVAVRDIAVRTVTPSALIDWFLRPGRENMLNMVFEAYKAYKHLDAQLSLASMNENQTKALMFDAFVDFGLFQRSGH